MYKSTSSASNFIFTLVMKVRVEPSVFASELQLFDVGSMLHLKHKYRIDTAARVLYKGLMAVFT